MTEPKAPKPIVRDEAFAAARKSGAVDAVGELLESYRAYLRVLAETQLRGRLSQRISPSDVVQETMLAAHRGFGDFRGQTPGEFSVWLRRILTHKLLSSIDRHLSLKRDARRDVSIDASLTSAADIDAGAAGGLNLLGFLAAADPSPSAIVSRAEDGVQVAQLLDQLPEHYRQVILMRVKRGMRFEEISVQLNRSPLAARLLWLRAIQRLRQLYDQEICDDTPR